MNKTELQDKQLTARFGFYISLITGIATLITFGIAVMTPPLSGPFCQGSCFEYPYTGILSRFPIDYYWMYPTMLLSLLYVLLMTCIHQSATSARKLFSQAGLALATISAAILIANYFIQVSVIQPSLLNNETEGIALLTQFNPHGLFIALEEIGFLLLNISLVIIIPALTGTSGILKAVRFTFLAGFILAILAIVFVAVKYGVRREYIFEVMIISIVWLEMIVASSLLSLAFRRQLLPAGSYD